MSIDPATPINPYASPQPVPPQAPQPLAAPASSFGSLIGESLKRAFEAYGRTWSQWLVPALVFLLIVVVSELLCVIPVIFTGGPMICGMFAIAFGVYRAGMPPDVSVLNRGWQLLGPAALVVLVYLGLALLPALLLYGIFIAGIILSAALGSAGGGAEAGAAVMMVLTMVLFYGGLFANMALQFFIQTRLMFALPLVADRGLGAREALRISWDNTRERFWELLLLQFLASLIGGLGVYVCYIGLIASLPLYFLIIGAAYEFCLGAWSALPAAAIPPGPYTPSAVYAGSPPPAGPPQGPEPPAAQGELA